MRKTQKMKTKKQMTTKKTIIANQFGKKKTMNTGASAAAASVVEESDHPFETDEDIINEVIGREN